MLGLLLKSAEIYKVKRCCMGQGNTHEASLSSRGATPRCSDMPFNASFDASSSSILYAGLASLSLHMPRFFFWPNFNKEIILIYHYK